MGHQRHTTPETHTHVDMRVSPLLVRHTRTRAHWVGVPSYVVVVVGSFCFLVPLFSSSLLPFNSFRPIKQQPATSTSASHKEANTTNMAERTPSAGSSGGIRRRGRHTILQSNSTCDSISLCLSMCAFSLLPSPLFRSPSPLFSSSVFR